jgi:signal transduction histidine kinase
VSAIAVATLALGVIALCAALLNGWVYSLRRSEPRHLWLALGAAGIVLCVGPTALLYGSESAATAIELRRALLVGIAVHLFGFVRFTEHLLGADLHRFRRVVFATLAFLVVASFVPGITFSGRSIERSLLGLHYVDAEVTPLAKALLLVFVATSARLFVAFREHIRRSKRPSPGLVAAAVLWLGCALADLASGAGLVELPVLFPLGQLGFVVSFTLATLRDFVDAMAHTEARALLLERLVDQRTQVLREKELQLAQGERLAAAGTLAAGLAHEINNPIAFVLANLNHLQALRKEECSEAEVEEVVLETQEGVARLRLIVDELLRLARTGERLSEPVQLARVVESVLPIVRHEAKGRVRIETSLAYAPLVSGDAGRLGQVVLNLVQNAIHALQGGEQGSRVGITVAAAETGVELCVEDDGPGIPDEVRPHIFEPFFTTKASGSGTGLGLAVTREIVGRHGGTIEVETGATGTRFRVTLPAADAAAVPAGGSFAAGSGAGSAPRE